MGPPVSYSESSFCPIDEACELVAFGLRLSDRSCQGSKAPSGEVCEPPMAIEEELLNILTEAVKDLGLDWSPPEQRVKNRMDMWFLQSGCHVAAPQRPVPFFP